MGVRRFEDLEVWQLANELHLTLVGVSLHAPGRRDYRFFDQWLSASRSVSANIAEGFGRYRATEFVRFLQIARGSIAEVQVHLIEAEARALVDPAVAARMRTLAARIAAALIALIKSLPVKSPVRC
jgi:four helix bundle protein